MNRWLKTGLFLFAGTASLFSQEKLTLEQALATALRNNYDIRIYRNEVEQSEIQKLNALSQFTPRISYWEETSYSNIERENYYEGQYIGTLKKDTTLHGAGYGISIGVNDIYGAVVSYLNSDVAIEASKRSVKSRIQQTLVNVTKAYFDLAKQKDLLEIQRQSVETNEQQVQRAESKYEIGSIAKKDVYTAKVQLNNAKSSYLRSKLALETAKNNLNILLGNDAFASIDVDDKLMITKKYDSYSDVKDHIENSNPQLLAQKSRNEIGELKELEKTISLFAPKVGLNIGYSKSVIEKGTLGDVFENYFDPSKDYGFSAKFSLSYGLGLGNYVEQQQAEIEQYDNQLKTQQLKKSLNAQLYQAFIEYQNSHELYILEQENLIAAKEDFRLSQERFNLGSGTSIDLKIAQDNLVSAEAKLISAKFDAKVAEVNIDRLLGLIPTK